MPNKTGYDITLANVSVALEREKGDGPDVYLPLGCLYLVSALEKAGFRVDFRDYQVFSRGAARPLDVDLFMSFLKDPAPVLGISCMVSMLPFVLLGTKRFKECHPDCRVVLGGPGPSGVADAIAASMPWIDVVGVGEGEATLPEILAALADGADLNSVLGISYRDSRGAHMNPPRPRIGDLDSVAMPAYERADFSAYTNVAVVTGRGCPHHCTFCDVGPLWGNKVLLRTVKSFIGEVALLSGRYGQTRINIADDTFALQRSRTEALCREMRQVNIKWSCLSRVDTLDEELLKKMADAGCDAIFLGIESGSNEVLARINKKFTIQEATAKAELATKYMKDVITSFIWGFPFETMDDFKRTIFSVVSMWQLGAMAGLKLLSPMPLSRLGIEYRDQIQYSRDLCSVFASLGNLAPGGTGKRAEIPAEFERLIIEFPDIFEGFYHIRSHTLGEKARYLGRFCEKFGIPA